MILYKSTNNIILICSSNILLDHCLRAKLADFGLAKVMPTPPPDKSYCRVESVRGSRAYVADEYFDGELSPKLDVHSFGVVCKTKSVEYKIRERECILSHVICFSWYSAPVIAWCMLSCAQTGCSKCACASLLQCNIIRVLFT